MTSFQMRAFSLFFLFEHLINLSVYLLNCLFVLFSLTKNVLGFLLLYSCSCAYLCVVLNALLYIMHLQQPLFVFLRVYYRFDCYFDGVSAFLLLLLFFLLHFLFSFRSLLSEFLMFCTLSFSSHMHTFFLKLYFELHAHTHIETKQNKL